MEGTCSFSQRRLPSCLRYNGLLPSPERSQWVLGVDSLIASIAIRPIMSRRLAACIKLVVLFGIGDEGGFLLGSAFHWPVPDSLSNILQTRTRRRWLGGLRNP
jgi:hypothetical protein